MMQLRETALRARTLVRIGSAARRLHKAETVDERRVAREHLRDVLSDARGVPMKVGQFLAASTGEDPLRTLVTGIDPLPLERIIPTMERQLGARVERVFRRFEPSRAAASLGQVHEAQLRGGAYVAVKVRYPGITAAVRSELRLAGLTPNAGPARKWGFDLHGYKTTLRDNMERELDYLDEARRQEAYRHSVRVDGLVVPCVYTDLCRRGLLVQCFESGEALEAAKKWRRKDRLALGRILLEALFVSMFRAGLVHGDPHEGNYRYRRDANGRPEVVLYDFGCTVEVARPARMALLQLIVRMREGGELDPLRAFGAMGFATEKLEAIQHVLPEVCELLLEPFTTQGAFDTSSWRLSERMAQKLGELRWWFRAAGPAQLFFLLRAFHGAVLKLEALDVRIPWWPILKRACGRALLDEARQSELGELLPVQLHRRPPVTARARLTTLGVPAQGPGNDKDYRVWLE